MRGRLWLLLAAALVIIALLLYPATQCQVTEAQLTVSPLKTFVIPVLEGYAVGFSFNVTNQATCETKAQKIHVVLRSLAYPDGRQVAQNLEETETIDTTLVPGRSSFFSYTFNSYFTYRPAKMALRVEISLVEPGTVLVFDGEVALPEAES